MRIILTGGGTAGHVNPAAAIAEEIMKREKNSEILFIGREGGTENRAIEKLGLKTELLSVRGFKRKLFGGNIKALLLALSARKKAAEIIKEFSPDVVMGTGGYVCWPVLRAAKGLGVKTLLHESNAVAGLVTKVLAKKCDKVLLGYKEAASSLSKSANCITVGNPLRKDFSVISRQKARNRLKISNDEILIVSFGGSGGAGILNEAVIRLMKEISVKDKRIRHVHAVGDRYYTRIEEKELKEGRDGCRIVPYIEDMPTLLSAADISITRSGALTLAELAFVGIASILVPSPNVAADHQYKNAKVISDGGGAILIREDELLYNGLRDAVVKLTESKEERLSLERKIKKFSGVNPAQRIYDEIKEII